MRLQTKKQASSRRGKPPVVKTMLRRRQTERGGKAFWDPKESDRHLPRGGNTSITNQPRLPIEAIMGPLSSGEEQRLLRMKGQGRWLDLHVYPLTVHQVHAGTAMLPAAPVAPEQGRASQGKRMEQHSCPPGE